MAHILAPGVKVNGIQVSIEDINAEVQYHPAENLQTAKYAAMKALVIKELLIQRAVELGLCAREEAVKNPDTIIEDLLDREIDVPEADSETCKRYYDQNRGKFFTSPLFQASHILYTAPPRDEQARGDALKRAQDALSRIQKEPALFEAIAREESSCSSGREGGQLGQLSRGQTMPAFETALFQMQEGETSVKPVETEVGYHIIRVHKRIEGRQLPFENAKEWILQDLQGKSWQRAFDQYMQILIGRSHISGFHLNGAQSPLVQ